ncbi:hypothetical protein M5K25_011780 [Dendrobium thyrsiflorum]|uniref:SHSP domain-containing protein n=1 Tax=Dendrobium thyrsiflorum TaxID=117978 RepID=A0ABD0V3M1_DENTH
MDFTFLRYRDSENAVLHGCPNTINIRVFREAEAAEKAAAAALNAMPGIGLLLILPDERPDRGKERRTFRLRVFKANLPGLKKEEVKVEAEEGIVLKISGDRKRDKEEKTDRWHRVERSSGSFLRSVRENTKVDGVKVLVASSCSSRSLYRRNLRECARETWSFADEHLRVV